jgi:hypothetical protein
MLSRDYRDVIGGALLLICGLLFSWYAAGHYELGTLRRMGPGMFPMALGFVLAGFGVMLMISAFFRPGPAMEARVVVPLFVLAGVAAFALLIRPFGLLPAILAVVAISSLAERRVNPKSVALLSASLCLLAYLVFRVGLGLAIPCSGGHSDGHHQQYLDRPRHRPFRHQPLLLLPRRLPRHADRRHSRHRRALRHRHAVSDHLLSRADDGPHHAGRHRYGTSYGGNTASILLNIPGTPANAVTCLDGYPMARQGRGGVALFMTTVASFVGGSIGIILLMLFAPVIARYALSFGSAEYFSLMVLGLVAASTISEGSAVKGLAMVVAGIIFGTVGADIYTGTPRFTFGALALGDGISLIALAMGIFGVAEVIASVRNVKVGDIDPESVKFRAMRPTRDDVRRSWFPMLRGSSIGAFFGTLPGTGPSVAAFLAYAMEKRVAKEPERFGKGAIEGIMAPESANNSADQTSFIPTLALGIPGSPTMALSWRPHDPRHRTRAQPDAEQPHLFWGLVMSFWIGNVILVILNVP